MKYNKIVANSIAQRQKRCFETQSENFKKAAEMMTTSWKNSNSVWIFSGAHGDITTQELHFRAGGFVNINPIYSPYAEFTYRPLQYMWEYEKLSGIIDFEWWKEPFEAGDTVILHSSAGCSAMMGEAIALCKEVCMNSIAITNKALSDISETSTKDGKRLYEVADVTIDTCGETSYGAVELKNGERLCSHDNIMGIFVGQSLVVAAATQMVNEGLEPPILRSVNRENAAVYNSDLIKKHRDSIHYKVMEGKYSNYYQKK